MKFGILAPGKIAHKMAEAVSGIPDLEKYAVASRDIAKAQDFANKWKFEKAYGSYEAMLEDGAVELIYVAPPHSLHYAYAKMCLEHGKHVLVEKPFTVNAKQAEELIRLAEEKGLLIAEAIWTRYMPSRFMLEKLLADGVIGEVSSLTANLGYVLTGIERLEKPELAGGALLDLGVYPINFALMAIPEEIKTVSSAAVLSPAGVDWQNSITLTFSSGKTALLHSNMRALTDRSGMIYGDKGYIEFVNINNGEEIRVFDLHYRMTDCLKVPEQINGFEYEVLSCMKAIREGKTECEEMPHSEILRIMRLMDGLRAEWGLVYPCDQEV
ncbi:MAG: Gfo/Idh/MocA family oxidoreductase [Lachnospiraceae bacterium]|nr:Gfo/Idh/MocA family oxidoreductase [Lachnospiraceae bacterium]